MLMNIYCAKCVGIQAVPVTVEVDISSGIGIHLVGLADVAVKESLLRTMTALQSLGFRIPGKKIVINLAPADVRKNGSGYDLPIALGILAASGQCQLPGLDSYIIMGELGLDGSVKPVPGAISIAEYAGDAGFAGCILPYESAVEASALRKVKIFGVKSLTDVIDMLSGNLPAGNYEIRCRCGSHETAPGGDCRDFADIIGQEQAKRGLEIAVSGGHNVIMIGSPGSGKTSLARALTGILPPMLEDEAIETGKIYSVAGLGSGDGLVMSRPFRAPHYSASLAAIIGGGNGDNIQPGEVSLAHNGILFLDEFALMPARVAEALRGPIEDRYVVISRLRSKVGFPSSFMLVAAANPCPCGYYGVEDRCTCSPVQRQSYLSRLSGPIMDRIDIQLYMHPISPSELVGRKKGEPSRVIASRVMAVRELQKERYAGTGISMNAGMTSAMLDRHCRLIGKCREIMERISERMGFSARAYTRILKTARTIADMEYISTGGMSGEDLREEHLAEAAGYRFLDRMM
ncbi:MAG: YifB family Mg chelatase-like AAA ATPase [Candidatus Cryptobacteroides sp.]